MENNEASSLQVQKVRTQVESPDEQGTKSVRKVQESLLELKSKAWEDRKCAFCGKFYSPRTKWQIYCRWKCRCRAYSNRVIPRDGYATQNVRPCCICGTFFESERMSRKYCDSCRGSWKRRGLTLPERKCQVCSKFFTPRMKEHVCCSNSCMAVKTRLRNVFGITPKQYNNLLLVQGGGCAICGKAGNKTQKKRGRLDVDHSHDSNLVRGLLCNACNRGLGNFMDNQDLLLKAAKYLENSGRALQVISNEKKPQGIQATLFS